MNVAISSVRAMEILDDEPGLILCAIVTAIVWFPVAAMVYDSTNAKMYVYDTGTAAWVALN